MRGEPAARRPNRDIRRAAARREDNFTESVAALKKRGVGADQHVPGKVAERAHLDFLHVTLLGRSSLIFGSMRSVWPAAEFSEGAVPDRSPSRISRHPPATILVGHRILA